MNAINMIMLSFTAAYVVTDQDGGRQFVELPELNYKCYPDNHYLVLGIVHHHKGYLVVR